MCAARAEKAHYVRLVNKAGDAVAIPEKQAKELFETLRMSDALAAIIPAVDEDESGEHGGGDEERTTESHERAEDADLVLDQLDYSKEVLEAVREYATWPASRRTSHIPVPLEKPLDCTVFAHELDFARRAETEHYLPQLLDIASYLKFTQLLSLCAAYSAMRIDELAKAAPTIMDGAERIRQFLQLENSWTEEEMKHLEREMTYAKESYRNVY